MKTAIQELIDSVGLMAQGLDAVELYDYFMEKATQMLEKEKQLLVDFFDEGREEEYQYHINNIKPIDGEEFYDYKFKK